MAVRSVHGVYCPHAMLFQVDAMFEKGLKRLEQDTWDAKRKPWKSAVRGAGCTAVGLELNRAVHSS